MYLRVFHTVCLSLVDYISRDTSWINFAEFRPVKRFFHKTLNLNRISMEFTYVSLKIFALGILPDTSRYLEGSERCEKQKQEVSKIGTNPRHLYYYPQPWSLYHGLLLFIFYLFTSHRFMVTWISWIIAYRFNVNCWSLGTSYFAQAIKFSLQVLYMNTTQISTYSRWTTFYNSVLVFKHS